jgi:hypothetical protein
MDKYRLQEINLPFLMIIVYGGKFSKRSGTFHQQPCGPLTFQIHRRQKTKTKFEIIYLSKKPSYVQFGSQEL